MVMDKREGLETCLEHCQAVVLSWLVAVRVPVIMSHISATVWKSVHKTHEFC